jgi:hypothetical protein
VLPGSERSTRGSIERVVAVDTTTSTPRLERETDRERRAQRVGVGRHVREEQHLSPDVSAATAASQLGPERSATSRSRGGLSSVLGELVLVVLVARLCRDRRRRQTALAAFSCTSAAAAVRSRSSIAARSPDGVGHEGELG